MKNMLSIFGFFFLLMGCGEEEVMPEQEQEPSIYGTWQLVEVYIGPPSGSGWEPIENEYIYEIRTDGTFSTTQFSECSEGTISFTEDEISFDYGCEGFTTEIESPPGTFTYKYSFIDGMLGLAPTFLSCIEGCGYKFKKIAEAQTEN